VESRRNAHLRRIFLFSHFSPVSASPGVNLTLAGQEKKEKNDLLTLGKIQPG